MKHLLAHIAYAWPYVCSIHHAATLHCSCSCSARAKQTNSAIFSAPSTDACSERANQLVSNTFRLLIITLRQARHQYEGYLRTQNGHWAAVPSMVRMAAQLCLPSSLLPFSFILWQTWRLLFLSHYYISIYFTKPKLKLKQTENAALGAQCCQRVAYLYALFVLVPAN